MPVLHYQHKALNFEGMQSISHFRHFVLGFKHYAEAFGFMRRHGLRHWYVIVGLVAFGTMLAVNALLDQMAGLFQGWMNNHVEGLTGAVEAWGIGRIADWISMGVNEALDWGVWLLMLWLHIKFTKYIVLVVMSPVFALFSEAVSAALDSSPWFNGKSRFWWSIFRGIRSAALLIVLEIAMSGLLFLFCFVFPLLFPVLAPLALLFPVLSALLSIWFYGAAVLDYAWEKEGVNALKSLRLSWRWTGAVLSLGLPFFLSMAVPLIGFLAGPLLGGQLCILAALCLVRQQSKLRQSPTKRI